MSAITVNLPSSLIRLIAAVANNNIFTHHFHLDTPGTYKFITSSFPGDNVVTNDSKTQEIVVNDTPGEMRLRFDGLQALDTGWSPWLWLRIYCGIFIPHFIPEINRLHYRNSGVTTLLLVPAFLMMTRIVYPLLADSICFADNVVSNGWTDLT
jgi:hypothetical protein